MPVFKINLATSAFHRWDHIFEPQDIKILQGLIKSMWGSFEDTRGKSKKEKLQFAEDLFNAMAAEMDQVGISYLIQEIQGIAHLLAVQPCELLLLHLSYESLMGCTAGLFSDASGDVRMFRTLDWDILPLKQLSIHIDVYNGDALLFQATTFKGYVGCLTGMCMRESPFGVAINWRGDAEEEENEGEDEARGDMDGSSIDLPIGFFVRHALQQADACFESFVAQIERTTLMAPCYVIVAGPQPNQGAVLTKAESRAGFSQWAQKSTSDSVVVQANIDSVTSIDYRDPTESIARCKLVLSKLQPNSPRELIFQTFLRPPICDVDTLSLSFLHPASKSYIDFIPILN